MIRHSLLLSILFALFAGCMSAPVPDDEGAFPTVFDGPPVESRLAGRPSGQWYAEEALLGAAVWVVELGELPVGHASWRARWTPTAAQGFITITGVSIEPVRGDGYVAVSSDGHARSAAAPFETQGLVHRPDASASGRWFVFFSAETYSATGRLELLVDWSPGEVHGWRPLETSNNTRLHIEEIPLEANKTLEQQWPTQGFGGVHLLLPCRFTEEPANEELDVRFGGARPNLIVTEGRHQENVYEDWLSYAGFWTYPHESVDLTLRYSGPSPPTAILLRSSWDVAQSLRDHLGMPWWVGASSPECLPQGGR